MNYSIELTRRNVTPAKFFAQIRFYCKKNGIDFGLDLNDFLNPAVQMNCSYTVIGGKKISHYGGYDYESDASEAPCAAERCVDLPGEYQCYMRNFDGSFFNEICEFTFDDEKTGHGYYFQANRD